MSFTLAPEQPAETQIFEAEGLWVKQIVVPHADMYLPQHAHVMSHLTLVAVGAIDVWRDGKYDRKYEAPSGVYIEAGVKHTFRAVLPGTVLYCIHALNTPDALKVLAEHQLID